MASDIRKKSDSDLEKLKDKRKSLQQFRFGSSGKVRNVKEGAALRRDIARILTELNSRRTQVTHSK